MNRWAQKFRAWGRNLKRFRVWTFFVGVPPAAPTDFRTTAIGSTAVNFAWTDNSDNEASFVFQRKANVDSTFVNCGTSAANTTEVQITDFTPSSLVDALNANFAVMWPGTVANIPSGWTRDTRFDGVYLKAAEASSDPTTGGAATHTHPNTSTSHVHTMTGGAASPTNTLVGTAKGAASGTHTHASANSAAATFAGAATNNAPPYYDMIFIKPTTGKGVPSNACSFFNASSLPASWSEHAGSKDYLLRGAATSADGGGTGGSATHTHNTDHTHGANNSTSATGSQVCAGSGGNFSATTHVHSVSLNSGSANVATASSDVSWYKLRCIQNGTGGEDLPNQIILLWTGTNATIPANWARYTDIDGVFLKCANNAAEVAVTATNLTHTHTGATHNHAATAGIGNTTVERDEFTTGATAAHASHTHTWTIGNANIGLTADSSKAHWPTYQEAIFVRFTPPTTDARMRAENEYGVSDWAGPITFTMLAAGAANPDPPGA